jgi:hypothetical protein
MNEQCDKGRKVSVCEFARYLSTNFGSRYREAFLREHPNQSELFTLKQIVAITTDYMNRRELNPEKDMPLSGAIIRSDDS